MSWVSRFFSPSCHDVFVLHLNDSKSRWPAGGSPVTLPIYNMVSLEKRCPTIQWFITYMSRSTGCHILMISFHFHTNPCGSCWWVMPFHWSHPHLNHMFSILFTFQFPPVKFVVLPFSWNNQNNLHIFRTFEFKFHHVWWSNLSFSDPPAQCGAPKHYKFVYKHQ